MILPTLAIRSDPEVSSSFTEPVRGSTHAAYSSPEVELERRPTKPPTKKAARPTRTLAPAGHSNSVKSTRASKSPGKVHCVPTCAPTAFAGPPGMPSATIVIATCPPCSTTSAPVPSVIVRQIAVSISGALKSSAISNTLGLATGLATARGGVGTGVVAFGACGFGTVAAAGALAVFVWVVGAVAIALVVEAGVLLGLVRAGAFVLATAVGGRLTTVGAAPVGFRPVVADPVVMTSLIAGWVDGSVAGAASSVSVPRSTP